MSKKNDFILKVLNVVSWIVFVGLCIEAGALLFNFILTLFKPFGIVRSKFCPLHWGDEFCGCVVINEGLFILPCCKNLHEIEFGKAVQC
jgi:hypothetical protein